MVYNGFVYVVCVNVVIDGIVKLIICCVYEV